MTLAITGHRPNKLGDDYNLTSPLIGWLKTAIVEIVKREKATLLITGMALGIDTLFARIAYEYKIPFVAAVPFPGQENAWPRKSQFEYKFLLSKAAKVEIVSNGEYSAWNMQLRNRWMVDNSDALIAVWDGTPGGTANCYKYAAEKVDKIIFRINPNDYKILL
jgi:uncharacterized phage-like protein YoqJ